jgi:putative transposase
MITPPFQLRPCPGARERPWIFPNDAAIVRLVGALLLEQNDEWRSAGYLSLETLAPFGHTDQLRLPAVAA